MMSKLIECAENMLKCYEKEGAELLINPSNYPEFSQIIAQLKIIQKENVGINEDSFQKDKISYFNLREDNDLCIGVFCLSKGTYELQIAFSSVSVMPFNLYKYRRLSLHDHPNMMVVSKVLCGKLERRSLDLLDRSYQEKLAKVVYIDNDYTPIGKILEAKINSDEIFVGGDVLTLTPERGNLHTFAALEDTAILDILLPNYDNETRICNFYYELDEENDIKELYGEKEFEDQEEQIIKPKKNKEKRDSKTGEKGKNGAEKGDKTGPEKRDKGDEKEDKKVITNDASPFVRVIYALPPSDLDIEIIPYKGDPLA